MRYTDSKDISFHFSWEFIEFHFLAIKHGAIISKIICHFQNINPGLTFRPVIYLISLHIISKEKCKIKVNITATKAMRNALLVFLYGDLTVSHLDNIFEHGI